MMLFDSEYAIYAEYLKSAIKLFKAGKKDGAFEMYMRNYLAPVVLPDELPQEKVEEACKNIFDEEVSEVEINHWVLYSLTILVQELRHYLIYRSTETYVSIQWTGTHQKRLNGNTLKSKGSYLLYDVIYNPGDLRAERSH